MNTCRRCGELKDTVHVCPDIKAAHEYARNKPDYLAAVRHWYEFRDDGRNV